MIRNRITYYSKDDLAGSSNLEKAEIILNNFDKNQNFTINDIIELFQIKKYFDNEVFLYKWTKTDIEKHKETIKIIWSVIVQFWNQINSSNLFDFFSQLECWTLESFFWELTSLLSAYKNINKETFKELITTCKVNQIAILHNEKIVNYYGTEIKNWLMQDPKSAEFLLSQFVEKNSLNNQRFYFPKCLTLDDKEQILNNYLDFEDPNVNFVNLILNVKNNDNIKVNDKIKLKARRLRDSLHEKYFNEITAFHFGVQVSLDENLTKPFEYSSQNNIQTYVYSSKYILASDHPIYYLFHFIELFKYFDNQQCISLVSNVSELDTLEAILMSSKYEYKTGVVFRQKDYLSLAQINLLDKVLRIEKNSNIELIISYCISEYFPKMFNLKGFRFKIPSTGTDYYEKIRILLAEFDSFLRQYKLYKENNSIDYELLEISSDNYSFSQIPSFVNTKYCYLKSKELSKVFHVFFMDYFDFFDLNPELKKQYHCLHDFLLRENISYHDINNYDLKIIDFLIQNDYLFVDDCGFVRFKNLNKIFIIKQLYQKGVLNYWHYDEKFRIIIDEMITNKILFTDNNLFNKFECDYLNYFLNKKEFTNGLDLRNSFMHGTNTYSEGEIFKMYYILLRIIILTILKINDDQLIYWKNKTLFQKNKF